MDAHASVRGPARAGPRAGRLPKPAASSTLGTLPAVASQVPASHNGQDAFTFELRFSETPKDDFSYKTQRDHAFTVTGGEVVNARRLNAPSNAGWEITVQPDGSGTVVIVLPVTTNCDSDGAVCTEDGVVVRPRGIDVDMFAAGTTFTMAEVRAAIDPDSDEVGPVGSTQ